ncbi:MAG TPA: 2-phosphosulfolactate phosphatase [Gemmatimonadales bacterium]|nr:2-phosphosulfolactate phosphatase [Gemmatimonadales bacterium]
MKIDVHFTPLGLSGEVPGRAVVVLDVLRSTTTIVMALANGAKAVVPAASSEEAVRMTSNLQRDAYLLAGERKSLKIPGFALGNSPREMTPDAVAGKTLFLATTNGTPALVACADGGTVLVGGAINFTALADRARELFTTQGDLVIVCAGREGRFALEDAYTAGRIVKAVKKGIRKLTLNDAATVALGLTTDYTTWTEAFEASDAARQLEEADLGDDIAFCAKADRCAVVPTYADRRIT